MKLRQTAIIALSAATCSISGDPPYANARLLAYPTSVEGGEEKMLRATARNLQTNPFVWEPYLIFDHAHNSRQMSMTVLWRSNTETCDICWDQELNCDSVSRGTGGLGSSLDHFKYSIPGSDQPSLTYSTTYDYHVTCGSEKLSRSFKTPPDPGNTSSNTKILAYGDSRTGGSEAGTVRHNNLAKLMTDYSPEEWYGALALHTGDLVNGGYQLNDWDSDIMATQSSTSTHYTYLREFMGNFPLNAVRGNHENCCGACGSSSFSTLYDEIFPYAFEDKTFQNPLSYSFDYGNIHVVEIDQYNENGCYDDSYAYGPCPRYVEGPNHSCRDCRSDPMCPSEHFTWLENDLSTANNRTPKPFLIAVIHQPLYSAGGHPNEIEPALQELFEDQDVDIVVLAGHNHYYARAEVNKKPGATHKVYHITTGGGGTSLYTPTNFPSEIKKTAMVHHYCRMDSYNDNNIPSYLCFEAIDITGKMIDFFEIDPTGSGRPTGYSHCRCDSEGVPDDICNDNSFCNGVETCGNDGKCVPGSGNPCGGEICVDATQSCGCANQPKKHCGAPDSPGCKWRKGDCVEVDPPTSGCTSNDDCEPDEECNAGQCECAHSCCSNEDCDTGHVCTDNSCVLNECGGSKASCSSNNDCCSGKCKNRSCKGN